MIEKDKAALRKASPYNGALTREQFLFYEMRIVAGLMTQSLSDPEIAARIVEDNLFQYPTERMIKNLTAVCIRRLHALNNPSLVEAIASQPSTVSKQICLYAMMKQYRLVWDFMVQVIGTKYAQQDFRFSGADVKVFFLRLQEQDDCVATWTVSTINKISQVLMRILIENEYIDDFKAERLNPVLISSVLESGIRENGDGLALPAFNCFW